MVVAAHAIVQQRRAVEVEQWPLHLAPTVRVPEHRHHVGQIVSRDIDAPAFPIDQPDVLASAISGQKEIPWCASPWILSYFGSNDHARASLTKQSLVEIAPSGGINSPRRSVKRANCSAKLRRSRSKSSVSRQLPADTPRSGLSSVRRPRRLQNSQPQPSRLF